MQIDATVFEVGASGAVTAHSGMSLSGSQLVLGGAFSSSAGYVDVRAQRNLTVSGSIDAQASVQMLNIEPILLAGRVVGQTVDIAAQSLYLSQGSSVDTSGRGMADGTGAGAGSDAGSHRGGGGAGHGGSGGYGQSHSSSGGGVYGDLLYPSSMGSGGGHGNYANYIRAGGAGGGVVNVSVAGAVELASGAAIRANGNDGLSGESKWAYTDSNFAKSGGGGGSGGSVLIVAAQVQGSGSITANGGAGGSQGWSQYWGRPTGHTGGGGGGGRVSLHLSTSLSASLSISASGGAAGGGGAQPAAAGTVYTDVAGNQTLLMINLLAAPTLHDAATAALPPSGNASIVVDRLVVENTGVTFLSTVHVLAHMSVSQSAVTALQALNVCGDALFACMHARDD